MSKKEKRDNKKENLSFAEQLALNSSKLNMNIDDKILEKVKTPREEIMVYKDKSNYSNNKSSNNYEKDSLREAFAPYNFIPLNEKVVPAEYDRDNIPKFDIYHDHLNTGYLELELETVTPLYIRGTKNEKDLKGNNKDKVVSDFYSPTGRAAIPGSSLRGMTRTMMEILSYGKFGFCDDKYLYYRGLADQSNLRQEYTDIMTASDEKNSKRSIHKMSAGIMKRRGFKYFITPAESFYQINKDESKIKIAKAGNEYKIFNFYQLEDSYIVVSGDMPGKNGKKKDWVIKISANSKNEFEVPEKDIKSYLEDNRGNGVPNLIKKLKSETEVPCFYTRWDDDKRVSFGHTAFFRLSYNKSIKEHTYQVHRDKDLLDIPEAVFGNENTFAGRLFFEDLILNNGQENIFMETSIPKILSTPKPTTFQHYLEQDNYNTKDLNTYNSEEKIRGNKLYWHKDGNNWQDREMELNKNLFDKLLSEKGLKLGSFPEIRTKNFKGYAIDTRKLSGEAKKLLEQIKRILPNSIHTLTKQKKVYDKDYFKINITDLELLSQKGIDIKDFGKYFKEEPDYKYIVDSTKVSPKLKEILLEYTNNDKSQHTKIKPVKPGITFTGRIRFENLSNVELGALLMSLNLPDGCFHKLGMAKPLGLGTVKIKAKLFLSDRKARYQSFFSEWKGIEESEADNISKEFEKYVLKKLGEDKLNSIWELKRLNHLKIMLNFENGKKLENETFMFKSDKVTLKKTGKSSYMTITPYNEFKDRKVLPRPGEIFN